MEPNKVKGITVTPMEAFIEPYAQTLTRMVGSEHAVVIREIMAQFCKHWTGNLTIELARASAKGIHQAAELAINPQYFEKRKERARKKKAAKIEQRKKPIVHTGNLSRVN